MTRSTRCHTAPLARGVRSGVAAAALALMASTAGCRDATAPELADADVLQLRPFLLRVLDGGTDSLQAWAFAGDRGWLVDASGWQSSAPAVAGVDGAGRVTGVAPGWATIRATVGDTVLASEVAVGIAFDALSMGWRHGCGVDRHGQAWCWGGAYSTGNPELGAGPRMPTPIPVPVGGGARYRSISAGAEATCAVTEAGALYCWGMDDRGQLGGGDVSVETCGSYPCATQPRPVDDPAAYRQVSVGLDGPACAVREDGTWVCWGRHRFDAFAPHRVCQPSPENHYCRTPTRVTEGRFTVVATGKAHACALDEAGAAWCLGLGSMGELGSAPEGGCSGPCAAEPVRVPGVPPLDTLVTSAHFTCGRAASHAEVWCWGTSDPFASPAHAEPPVIPPTRLLTGEFGAVGAWSGGMCAVDATAGLRCVDSGSLPPAPPPGGAGTPVAGPRQFAGGLATACLVDAAGEARCGGAPDRTFPLPPPGERPGGGDR